MTVILAFSAVVLAAVANVALVIALADRFDNRGFHIDASAPVAA
ncbi:hypothetical protein [Methylobacterium sp. A54F]